MGETFYVVRRLINCREGVRPSTFSTKEEAIEFIDELKKMETEIKDNKLKIEYHLYECKEINF